MGNDNQIQKAGDNSQQLIVGNMNITAGITEQRAREIFAEMNAVARRDYTQDAYELAFKRVKMFEELLMNKIEKVDGMLEAFADPSFQFLLTDAQKKAAASEREADYELLTELLAHRVKNSEERKIKASIKRAVEIVDQVDDDALCGMTIVHTMCNIFPVSGFLDDGLKTLADLYDSLLYTELPNGSEWLDHLSILNAIRPIQYSGSPQIENLFEKHLSGYFCIGINKDSENYKNAINILEQVNIAKEIFVENELVDGFVRIPVSNNSQIAQLGIWTEDSWHSITNDELKAIKNVISLYSDDSVLKNQMKTAFMLKWNEYKSLRIVAEWWNKIPQGFTITSIGRMLSHANAQRCNPKVPNLNQY